MLMEKTFITSKRLRGGVLTVAAIVLGTAICVGAHPLGNFTINHFARIEPRADRINLHYVIDMAEIPAFQELQKINRDALASSEELAVYATQLAPQLAANLLLMVDGEPLALSVLESR